MTRVLLYSAGMDSHALRVLWPADVHLYVDMHTRYSPNEVARLPADVTVVDFPGLTQWERSDLIIPARNLFLVAIAAQYGTDIALAATAGDRVLDKSHGFAERASDLLSYLWQPQHWTDGKQVTVHLPIKGRTKTQLVADYKAAGGDPVALARESFSCYTPTADGAECGACKPCWRKWVAFTCNGYPDAAVDAYPYVMSTILPLVEAGNYGRKGEEDDVRAAVRIAQHHGRG